MPRRQDVADVDRDEPIAGRVGLEGAPRKDLAVAARQCAVGRKHQRGVEQRAVAAGFAHRPRDEPGPCRAGDAPEPLHQLAVQWFGRGPQHLVAILFGVIVRAEQVQFGVHDQGLALRHAVAHPHDVGLELGKRGVPAERRQANRGEVARPAPRRL